MATGSSTIWRRHSFSQGRGQMRPMTVGKGIALLDDLNRTVVIAHGDLPDVFPDIDAGRAGPLAGGGAFVVGVFPEMRRVTEDR
jgi:hypothetical protein